MLNHINLCASDVPALTAIMTEHFGYRVVQKGTVPHYASATNPGSRFAFLLGDDCSVIVISEISAPPAGASAYPPQFHFGVMHANVEQVYRKHVSLTAAGLSPGPINTFEAFEAVWTSFTCPLGDGLEIEVNHRTPTPVLDNSHIPLG